MFTAHIFFCVMLAPVPECAIADDTRGPYEVEEKCVARLGEMQSALGNPTSAPQGGGCAV